VTAGRLRVPVDLGSGPAVVLLHGYGMRPHTYADTAALLAGSCRVLVPDLFAVPAPWRYDDVLDRLTATLDDLGLEQLSMIGHSFGGGIELGFAVRHPDRVRELVFSDTLACSAEWGLADEALRHPFGLLRLATAQAASAFAAQALLHPRQMVEAAWWGFRSRRTGDMDTVARARIPAHVLWANRDSILPRTDGRRFAERLHGTFAVAWSGDGKPVDHDWMFQDPKLFIEHLRLLGLRCLGS
jgi:pimeloyl-ACP methyl ester carboxylesterase